MKVSDLPRIANDVGRFREVASVLLRYGFAPWLKDVKLGWIQKQLMSVEGELIANLPEAVRFREALTELGTTYIKLGQILSTRPDLVGPEIAEELSNLQSGTPADSPDVVARTIEEDLGQPPEKLFREFDAEAFASASIGQVHNATLPNGVEVVVKVQHDGIEERITNDLDILVELCKLAESYSTELENYRPVATAKEFRRTLLAELDFTREMENAAQFTKNFEDDESIQFPTPYPKWCSRRVLTMAKLNGIGVGKRDELAKAGYDLTDIARRGADTFLKMVFRDGFYHADPHPGNLMILDGEVIGVLDCGMVGRVDEDLRDQVEDLLMGVMGSDAEQTVQAIVEFGHVPMTCDRNKLRQDVAEFVDEFGSQSVEQFDVGGALNGVSEIVRDNGITLPSRVSMLIKMMVMLEGTAQQLSPAFSVGDLLRPYQTEAMLRRLSPQRLFRMVRHSYRSWSRLIETFPGDVADIINGLRVGSFDVHLEHRRLEVIANRLVYGILTAALFMGSASLWSNGVKPHIAGMSLPGVLGCVLAVFNGAVLMRSIKSGRKTASNGLGFRDR